MKINIPKKCELCGLRNATKIGTIKGMLYSPWAHVCDSCFDKKCEHELEEKRDAR